ncbi:MAG: helix-turn-helix domain-containing protein [Lachnospiraceae bacterium]|nr:helix-turn-helix domain-containing protein [Lachnospiraceae bacterium]
MKLYKYNNRCNISGLNIRKYREAAKMSQEQLASSLQLLGLDLTQKAVSRTETGGRVVPDFELCFFAKALQVSVENLLKDE